MVVEGEAGAGAVGGSEEQGSVEQKEEGVMTRGSTVGFSIALCWLSLVGEASHVSWASSTTSVLQRYNDMSLGSSACVANAEVTSARNAQRPGQPLDATAQYYLRPWFGELVDKVRVVWKARLNDHLEIARRVLTGGSRAQTYWYQVYMARDRGRGTLGIRTNLSSWPMS